MSTGVQLSNEFCSTGPTHACCQASSNDTRLLLARVGQGDEEVRQPWGWAGLGAGEVGDMEARGATVHWPLGAKGLLCEQ